VDLEDALTAAQQRNEQQEKLIAFLQQNIEAFQATQHELIEQIRALNRILEQEKEASTARIAELEAMIRRLTAKLDALLVLLGEKDPPEKPDKDDEEASKTTSSSDDTEKPKGTSGWKHPNHNPHNGKSGPPAHLARDESSVAVEGCCPHCQCESLHRHSELVSEAYDLVRAHIRVRRIIREVRRCKNCRKRVTAPMPPMPFEPSVIA
jgi:hypothetical protein